MKKLLLMRHAKTERVNDTDFTRNLVDRGISDANLMSKTIINAEVTPDFILSSSANRAKQTSEILAKKFNLTASYHEELYLANPEKITNFIKNVNNQVNNLLLIAHNPGIENMLSHLFFSTIPLELPTSGLIYIQIYAQQWHELLECDKVFKWAITPKVLRN